MTTPRSNAGRPNAEEGGFTTARGEQSPLAQEGIKQGAVKREENVAGISKESEKKPFEDFSMSRASTDLEQGDGTGRTKTRSPVYVDDDGSGHYNAPAETAKDLVTEVLRAEDDPTLSPWTFRTWFLGIGLSVFGGTLATIYTFKPQTVSVSTVFLAVISFVIGELMAGVLPKKGVLGRLLNPHAFNSKEHAAIMVMAGSAANAPLAIEVLSVNKLYYDRSPYPLVGILLLFSSQCLGYGVAGLLRKVLVYPTKMLFPTLLPLNSLIEVLHGEKQAVQKRLRVFYIGFVVLFFWEFFPQYIMPVLTGISIFCLARRNSLVFTNIFGGANGNEGLGLFSLCLDWNYISGGSSPMALPLQTLMNALVGYIGCVVLFAAIFYANVWNSRNFPFLSQLLYTDKSNGTSYDQFNQTQILNSNFEVDFNLLESQGLPWFTGTFMSYILSTNLAITATFTHLLLWNYDDIKIAWSFASPAKLKRALNPSTWNFRFWRESENTSHGEYMNDPHYKLMLAYKDAPNWWYGLVFIVSIVLGLISLYYANSTLPWWGFLVAISVASVCILFFGAQYGITGFAFVIQPVIQMLGGYLHPGKPVANMYFVLFGYNSVSQGQLLLRDLKFAQYAHLSPRSTFTMQMMGTVIGSIFSFIIMDSITTNQREILLSIEGTNVWSGQNIQSFNSQAIAWGGLANKLFSVGGRYQWVTLAFVFGFLIPLPFYFAHKFYPKLQLNYWNTAIITYFMGFLFVGINSSVPAFFAVGIFSQLYLRKRHANWFIKYNYVLSAALDGGTQVLVFLLTFTVLGGGGKEVKFPPYWGNNFQTGNFDFCLKDPAQKG